MKKTVILGAMLLSTVAFAKGYNQNGNGQNEFRGANNLSNLSEEQKEKLQTLRAEHFSGSQEERLEIEGLNLEIEKLLAEEDVDWKAVNEKVEELANLESELELVMLKNREEIKTAFGDDAPMFSFGRENMQGNRQGNRDKGGNGRDERGMRGNGNSNSDSEKGMGRNNQNDKPEFRGNQSNDGRGNRVMNDNDERGRFNQEGRYQRHADLTDEQVAKIDEIKKAETNDTNKLRLAIEIADNDIQKLLIADDIDWNAVESKVNEKAGYKAEIKINNYETREAIEDITGEEMIRFAKGRPGQMQGGMGRNFNR